MPQTPHLERYFTASNTVRDIVIGMSDDWACLPDCSHAAKAAANRYTCHISGSDVYHPSQGNRTKMG
jgi:hypothetical protein